MHKSALEHAGFFNTLKGGEAMAKGKYQEWITDEGLLKIEGWARDGLTDKQIAYNIGVTEQTLNNWKNKYPSLFESLKRGKEVVDRQVENALLKRALGGFSIEEVTKERVTHPETGEPSFVVTKKVSKEVLPDTTAQIFWLKNRKPTEWRDLKQIDGNVNVKQENPFEGISTDDIKKLIRDG